MTWPPGAHGRRSRFHQRARRPASPSSSSPGRPAGRRRRRGSPGSTAICQTLPVTAARTGDRARRAAPRRASRRRPARSAILGRRRQRRPALALGVEGRLLARAGSASIDVCVLVAGTRGSRRSGRWSPRSSGRPGRAGRRARNASSSLLADRVEPDLVEEAQQPGRAGGEVRASARKRFHICTVRPTNW